ncbi:potassium channel protein [Anaerolineales bacterium]
MRIFYYLTHQIGYFVTALDPLKRVLLLLMALLLLVAMGTVGYMILEGWDVLDSFYMTVITVGTVGFGEVLPLSDGGQFFTIILILIGVGIFAAIFSNAVGVILEPLFWTSLNNKRKRNEIMKLEQHYIVCGYGRMGRQITRDLKARKEKFVVIDTNEDLETYFNKEEILNIYGDATEDEVLQKAGIERAKGLVAALNSDSGNLMTVLSARVLNPDLFIVARAVRAESENKLKRAGADRVVNPYSIGGHRIALTLLRPSVNIFLDTIFHLGDGSNTDIGQLKVSEDSPWVEKTIGSTNMRNLYEVSILGIHHANGEITMNPSVNQIIHLNDVLIVIGPSKAIYKIESLHSST